MLQVNAVLINYSPLGAYRKWGWTSGILDSWFLDRGEDVASSKYPWVQEVVLNLVFFFKS